MQAATDCPAYFTLSCAFGQNIPASGTQKLKLLNHFRKLTSSLLSQCLLSLLPHALTAYTTEHLPFYKKNIPSFRQHDEG